MPSSFGQPLALLTAALLLSPPSFAFDTPLSDQAIREAYFLGQRRDERTTEFLEKYRRYLPLPESGPWVSTVELLTPYAEIVELSRQRSFGYSAQAAAKDYRERGNLIRVTVTFEFMDSYGPLIEGEIKQRSSSTKGYTIRPPDFWKDFSYRLFDGDTVIEPVDVQGNATYRSEQFSSVMTGASIVLIYNAEKISQSAGAAVVVDLPSARQVVAPFDLSTLR